MPIDVEKDIIDELLATDDDTPRVRKTSKFDKQQSSSGTAQKNNKDVKSTDAKVKASTIDDPWSDTAQSDSSDIDFSGLINKQGGKSNSGGKISISSKVNATLTADDASPVVLPDATDSPLSKTLPSSSFSGLHGQDESKRAEIVRPPTRSGPAKPATKSSVNFDDDDDVTDEFGLGSRPAAKSKSSTAGSTETGKSKNFFDEFLSGKPAPSTRAKSAGESKYEPSVAARSAGKVDKSSDEDIDMKFGGYTPSAATNSRPSSKRSVRFTDSFDFDKEPPSKLSSTAPASLLENLTKQDNRDWLELAIGADSSAEQKRPRSEGSERKNTSKSKNKEVVEEEERVDWLGFSHIGSPDVTPRTTLTFNDADEAAAARNDDGDSSDSDDLSKLLHDASNVKRTSEAKSPAANKLSLSATAPQSSRATHNVGKDGLEFTSKSEDNYSWLKDDSDLSPIADKHVKDFMNDDWSDSRRQPRMDSNLDSKKDSAPDPFAGDGKRKSVDSRVGTQPGVGSSKPVTLRSRSEPAIPKVLPEKIASAADDYLELGEEIRFSPPITKMQPVSNQKLNMDGLFGAPVKEDLSKSLPWKISDDEPKAERSSHPRRSVSQPPKEAVSKSADNWLDLFDELDSSTTKKASAGKSAANGVSGQMTKAESLPLLKADDEEELFDDRSMLMDLKRQSEERLRSQQQALLQQQKQSKAIFDKQLQAQLEELRRQEEQQLQVQQEQLRVLRDQQLKALQQNQEMLLQQSMGSSLNNLFLGGSSDDLLNRVKQLECEKQFLQNKIDVLTEQHEEEKKMLQDSYQQRLKLNEETFKKREDRLKQENELISAEILEKAAMLDKEKSQLYSLHLRKQSELDSGTRSEIDRLNEQHRLTIDNLQHEHEAALERLTKIKNLELDSVLHSRDHTKNLESAIQKIEENALDLQQLNSKVEFKHSSSLTDRENAARARDEGLKIMQDRLEREQHENQVEKARLQGLISKLETQLVEQVQQLEQEKWKVRQEENSNKTTKRCLDEERTRLIEQLERDRMDLEKSRTKLLDDQQNALKELNHEKIALAEDRARLNVSMKLGHEDTSRTSNKIAESEAEIAAGVRVITTERTRLESRENDLESELTRLRKDKEELAQQRRLLTVEKQKLEQVALAVQDKSNEIDDVVSRAAEAQQEGQKMFSVAKQLETEHSSRLAKIQSELQTLHEKQKQMAEERLSMAKDKQELDKLRNSALCYVCRTPLSDQPPPPALSAQSSGAIPVAQMMTMNSTPGFNSSSGIFPDLVGVSAHMTRVYKTIEMDKYLRRCRMDAEKDWQFLEEERFYLEALRYAPYHNDKQSFVP